MGYRRRGWGWRTTWNHTNHNPEEPDFVGPCLIWFLFAGPILAFLAGTIAAPFGWFVYFTPVWLGIAAKLRVLANSHDAR